MLCKNCGAEFEGNFCQNCGSKAVVEIPALKEPFYMDIGGIHFDVNLIIRVYGLGLRKIGTYAYISQKCGLPQSVVKKQIEHILEYHLNSGEKTGFNDGIKAQMELGVWERENKDSFSKITLPKLNEIEDTIPSDTVVEPAYEPPKKEDVPSFKQWRQGATYQPEQQYRPEPPYQPAPVQRVVVEREKPHKMSKRELKIQAHNSGQACCPKCGSTSLSGNKKGFGVGKAVAGAFVAGPLGLMAGNINAKKVWVTCLNCGKRWKM